MLIEKSKNLSDLNYFYICAVIAECNKGDIVEGNGNCIAIFRKSQKSFVKDLFKISTRSATLSRTFNKRFGMDRAKH